MDSSVSREEPLVTVEGVSFNFRTNWVLVEVSLSIMRGDFLAIIGPNGSGKTTLIKIILGLLSPLRGEVRLLGQRTGNFTLWEKVGYVPQKATQVDPFFPASAREVVATGLLAGKGFPRFTSRRDEHLIDRALDQVDMLVLKHRRIGELSGGQQQRVFIARAIVDNPEILFLDEPTTGVDAETQERFYDMLDSLNRKNGITIALITHDVGVVTKHVNKVACLNQRLVFHGSHEEFCNSGAIREMMPGEYHLVCHHH
jgi:zinc transport system ATP-binding protein